MLSFRHHAARGDESWAIYTGDDRADVFTGTGRDDAMYGAGGNDVLRGGRGGDRLDGGLGNDTFFIDDARDQVIERAGEGYDLVRASIDYALTVNVEALMLSGAARRGTGNDSANRITGTDGDDILSGLGGDDVLIGGAGADMLIGGEGRDVLNGGTGLDTLIGGAGDDLYYQGAGQTVVELADEGYDTVVSNTPSFRIPDNVERLIMTYPTRFAEGNNLDNVIFSSAGSDTIHGLGGNDVIHSGQGRDVLYGDDGNDVLISESPRGTSMYGGEGADRFVLALARSSRADFSHSEGDIIDLRQIDANSTTKGNDAFTFIGSNAFHGVAGELQIADFGLAGDLNGDGQADFTIVYYANGPTAISDILL